MNKRKKVIREKKGGKIEHERKRNKERRLIFSKFHSENILTHYQLHYHP
jgi:hypothetical protein